MKILTLVPRMHCNIYFWETGRKFNTRLDEYKSDVEKVCSNVTRTYKKESLTTIHKSAIADHVVDTNYISGWGKL